MHSMSSPSNRGMPQLTVTVVCNSIANKLLCFTGLELKLLTFNRQMRIFGVMQMDLQWDYGGTINAQLQIGAIPLIIDSASTR